jgi:tRNA splicing endonuclease
MDLRSLDTRKACNESTPLVLIHPVTGDDLGTTIHLLGIDSDAYKNATKKQQERILKQAMRNRNMGGIESAERERMSLDLLASCIVGWDGLELDGQALPFSYDNATRVIEEFPWIREQVDKAVHDRGFFVKSF